MSGTINNEPNPGDVIRERFKLIKELGKGGMGESWLAEDIVLSRQVVLKAIKGSLLNTDRTNLKEVELQRFLREGRNLAQVEHEHVVKILEFIGDPDLPPLLVMEFINGTTLESLLNGKKTGLPWRDAVHYIMQASSGIQALHDRRIFHRDIKPGNIMVNQDGIVKLIDFGLTKWKGEDDTITENIWGTPPYMSPEQADNTASANERSDVYSLGATLYHLVTGYKPFEGDAREILIRLVCDKQMPLSPRVRNRDISIELEAVILRAMKRDYALRYETAKSLQGELRKLLNGEPVDGLNYPPFLLLWRWLVQHQKAIAVAVVFSLVIGTITWLKLSANHERSMKEKSEELTGAINNLWLKDVLEQADPFNQDDPRELKVSTLFDRVVKRLEEGDHTIKDPIVLASMYGTIGQVYASFEKYDESLKNSEKFWQACRNAFGEDDPRTLTALNNVGIVLKHLDQAKRSEELLRNCLDNRKRVLGTSHRDTLVTMDNLAGLLITSNDPQKVKQGELLYEECLRLQEQGLGPHDIDTVGTRLNWGVYLLQHGRKTEAEEKLQKCIEGLILLQKPDLKLTAHAMNALSGLYRDSHNDEKAEQLLRDLRGMLEKRPGPNHPLSLIIAYNLGVLLHERNKTDEAEPILRETLERQLKRLPMSAQDVASIQHALGAMLTKKQQFPEAEDFLRKAQAYRNASSPSKWQTANTESLLGECLRQQRKFQDAEPFLLDSLVKIERASDVPVLYHRRALERIIGLYDAWGKPDQAAPFRDKLKKLTK